MTPVDSQVAALIQLRAEIEGIGRIASHSGAAATDQAEALSYSYGLFSGLSPVAGAEQTVAEIVASVRTVLTRLAPVATIESSSEGMSVQTVVHYAGRADSVWSNLSWSYASAEFANAHIATIQKTYTLRVAFVGAIGAVGNALAAISLAVANPLTVLHALASARALKRALERLVAAVEAS